MEKHTHDYLGMGKAYAASRKGSPEFVDFMLNRAQLTKDRDVSIIELGVGTGQQTSYVDEALIAAGIGFQLLAYDKSFSPSAHTQPGQLNILSGRIVGGELSDRIVPVHHDFDGKALIRPNQLVAEAGHVYGSPESSLLATGSVDLAYMAIVHHHLSHRPEVFQELGRAVRAGGSVFSFGAVIENLVSHPLNDFFPSKYEFDAERYPTQSEMERLFTQSDFSFESPEVIVRDRDKRVDSAFLQGVEDTTINSALARIRDERNDEFRRGVDQIRDIVSSSEGSGEYQTFNIERTIFWGVHQ